MSIIERNIASLESKFIENIEYEDIDYRGYLPDEQLVTVTNGASIINDLKLWIQSNKGDYYRRYNMGGYFDDNLKGYSLDEAGKEALEPALKSQIEKEFPYVEVLFIQATPLLYQRRWTIKLIVRDILTGFTANVDTAVSIDN